MYPSRGLSWITGSRFACRGSLWPEQLAEWREREKVLPHLQIGLTLLLQWLLDVDPSWRLKWNAG